MRLTLWQADYRPRPGDLRHNLFRRSATACGSSVAARCSSWRPGFPRPALGREILYTTSAALSITEGLPSGAGPWARTGRFLARSRSAVLTDTRP